MGMGQRVPDLQGVRMLCTQEPEFGRQVVLQLGDVPMLGLDGIVIHVGSSAPGVLAIDIGWLSVNRLRPTEGVHYQVADQAVGPFHCLQAYRDSVCSRGYG